jgi:allantoate deiminase
MYDGALGIVCAISALKVLKVTGKLERLTRPVEVREFSSVSSLIVLLLRYPRTMFVSLQFVIWLR